MPTLRPLFAIPLAACLAGACMEVDLDEDLIDSDQAAINDGFLAREWMWRRAVEPQWPCSATLIAPRHVLTALHCAVENDEGTIVRFYSSATTLTGTRTVVSVHHPLGTSRVPLDTVDWTGLHSDMAILELNADAPATSQVAPLEWAYPGPGAPVVVVGSGNHDDAGENDDSELRFVTDEILSANDSGGTFLTEHNNANSGDSGGARYHDRRLLGVITKTSSSASVSAQLIWILDVLDWQWPFGPTQVGVARIGTSLDSFPGTELRCQYACAMTSACSAYNYNASTCTLMTGATSPFSIVNFRSDTKP